jgi:ATP-dependent DNA ligase
MPAVSRKTVPMEARSAEELPTGPGWQYEPKWDGFRCLAFKDGDKVELLSRNQRPLNRYFPELVAIFAALKIPRCVLDGEIVLLLGGKVSFEALQQRLHPAASRIEKLSVETPVSFVAFDILSDAKGNDLRGALLSERRTALETLFKKIEGPQLQLSPMTASAATAQGWLKRANHGFDGIVAKRQDDIYHPGERAMVKFKIWKTVDTVVAAFYENKAGKVEYLLLGLYDDAGLLHHVGRTRPPDDEAATRKKLAPVMGGDGFTGRSPGGKNRWSGKERKPVMLKPKLVAEVSADHITGEHMRHGSRFLRWRFDKKPEACTMDQLTAPRRTAARQQCPGRSIAATKAKRG